MHSWKTGVIVLFALCLLSVVATPAEALLPDTTYFDFTGWDHNTIVSTGQIFDDIHPGFDVTVSASGSFSNGPSTFGGASIRSSHSIDAPDMDQIYTFDFTASDGVAGMVTGPATSLPLVVKTQTVDPQERVWINASGTESYHHDYGAPPTVSNFMSGINIEGSGFGINEMGAALGETTTSGSQLNIHYRALSPININKYEFTMVGTTGVPEPGSMSLLGFAVLGGLSLLRRRN